MGSIGSKGKKVASCAAILLLHIFPIFMSSHLLPIWEYVMTGKLRALVQSHAIETEIGYLKHGIYIYSYARGSVTRLKEHSGDNEEFCFDPSSSFWRFPSAWAPFPTLVNQRCRKKCSLAFLSTLVRSYGNSINPKKM